MHGIPTDARLRISVWSDSISRSRSGLRDNMMAGCLSRSIAGLEKRRRDAIQTDLLPLPKLLQSLEFIYGGI